MRTYLSYGKAVKGRQFLRKLRQAGVEVVKQAGKGGHYGLSYQGNQTVFPMHGDRDMGPGLMAKICKQLGLHLDEVI